MKKLFKITTVVVLSATAFFNANAGNKDRAGEAGATELLINPWARSSGWGGSNSATAKGLEGSFLNVAGIAHTQRTEVVFSHTQWMKGSDISVNGFGFTQKVGSSGAMGLSFSSFNIGTIPITTVDQPDGGLGTFSPQFANIGLAYAKEFSNSIYGGINLKVISEQGAANIKAQGVALDAGIQYQTGKRKEVHFGIALKNVGAPLHYQGDGLSSKATMPTGTVITIEQRMSKFELPSLLNIAGAYDYYINKDNDDYRITGAGTFTANSFQKNQMAFGLELAWKNMLMVRGGYVIEKKSATGVEVTSVLTGPSLGVTFEPKMNKEKASTFAVDYSYRQTKAFGGCHSIGVRINL